MSENDLREQYGYLVARPVPEDRPACPPADTFVDLLEGRLPEPERVQLLLHVTACGRCSPEFALLHSVTVAGRQAGVRRARRWGLAAAAAVAALAVGGGWWTAARDPVPPVMRGIPGGIGLVAPGGTIRGGGISFTWNAVDRALRYELHVVDAEGASVAMVTVRDTVHVLMDSTLAPGSDYRWWVRAILPGGRARQSPPVTFRIEP